MHRIREQIRIALWNLQYKYGCTKFISGSNNDFSFCNNEEVCLPTLAWKPVERQDVQAIIDNKIRLFGGPVIFERNANDCWRTAPDTNKLWPRSFFASINYREGNPYGDARVVWEASRLQYLLGIALYIAQNPETELKDSLLDIVRTDILSWYKQNPVLHGVHYIASLECGIRILALTFTCDLLRKHLSHDNEIWQALCTIVLEHAYFIRRRLSLYSSTGNHTLGETAGLVYAGLLFAEHPSAHDWLDTGLTLFAREFDNQIDEHGVGVEQATQYYVQILDYGLLIEKLLLHKNVAVPPTLQNALQRGTSNLTAIYTRLGTMPELGDSDSASALSPYLNELWKVPSEQDNQNIYSNGSCSVMSGQRSMADFAVLLDYGALGMPPNFSHGHADALSVTMYSKGRAILVDPSSYCYTGAPALRNYFRSTQAHNTATVNHLDQAAKKTLFMWSKPYTCKLLELRSEQDKHIAIAAHDGFAALGINHVRHVTLHHDYGLLVVDHFVGESNTTVHEFDIYWHIDGTVERRKDNSFRLIEDGLTIDCSKEVDSKIIWASENHTVGWRSQNYLARTPISSLILSARSTLPFIAVTAFSTDKVSQAGNGDWWQNLARNAKP